MLGTPFLFQIVLRSSVEPIPEKKRPLRQKTAGVAHAKSFATTSAGRLRV